MNIAQTQTSTIRWDYALPPAVFDLAIRMGADPLLALPEIHLEQKGCMRQKLDSGKWTDFHAKQTISLHHCAFEWRAWSGLGGMISVSDALAQGHGELEVCALGLFRLAHFEDTNELARGELLRYLAELAWAPDAILLNRELRWRVISPREFIVAAGQGDRAAQLTLYLDEEGRIAEAFACDRPFGVDGGFVPTPWRGRMSDYRRVQGRWIPFAGEVAWVVEGKEELYWVAALNKWDLGAAAPLVEPVDTPLI